MYNVKAYDGIKDLLNYLKNNNIKICVLSNKPHERTIENVEGIFGSEYFDYILGERDNIKRKPSPDGAIIITKKLNVLPKDCLYIGDTNTPLMVLLSLLKN